MTPDSLAALSDSLFSVSVALYSLAVVAFCAQLAFGRRPAPARELVGAGGPAGPAAAPAPAPAEDSRGRRWGAIAIGLTALGALAHTGVLVARGLATDRLPWGNMYEFSTATVLVAVVVYLVFALRAPGLRHIGLFVLAPVVLSLVAIGLRLYAEAGPVVAALRSYWLAIHVSTAVIGFGVFVVSGIASVLYLLKTRHDARVASGEASQEGILARLPGAAALDRVAHRTAVFGFPIWTFAVIAGAVWAEAAWGRFWGWDPKETWAFIAWVVYAAYLHARTTAGWRGKPAAWVNVVGLGVMIFNLTFVNMVSTGLHSYAGVS
ncbi:c-type cytochrome biogenesis protein CcsB [Blastococcus sp. CT_GayMR20]|uniref:c-type cytochrome biogenesis protein CcsB n=1 Tax=Blastococcus sp. CT_GayMR20 TaxID=2559609 RepID=UPI001073A354|nr:c-type cytochrome biogenesis protein CcsB [Blastococcus sp. CT_GayMR20]TFV64903.1 c-type cytochrome biogenesis protein CcsB [Blastococcus sp. CT_GayMR20]